LGRRRCSQWLLGLGVIVAGAALSACGGSTAKSVNTALATNACHSFLVVSSNTPGLLGGGGLPKDQTWNQVLDSASADAKASGDSDLYKSIQSASAFIVASYDPTAVFTGRISRSQFNRAEAQVNEVGNLCDPFGVGIPSVASATGS
jgi:hypothetical protein